MIWIPDTNLSGFRIYLIVECRIFGVRFIEWSDVGFRYSNVDWFTFAWFLSVLHRIPATFNLCPLWWIQRSGANPEIWSESKLESEGTDQLSGPRILCKAPNHESKIKNTAYIWTHCKLNLNLAFRDCRAWNYKFH